MREITLPISKSIAARQLLLDYVLASGAAPRYSYLQEHYKETLPLDIRVLGEALNRLETNPKEEVELDCHESGTALRLLLSLAASREQSTVLLMAPRLTERPIEQLINLYEQMGATFRWKGRALHVTPVTSRTFPEEINTHNWVSSQFSSAILLTAPLYEWSSLQLRYSSKSSSYSYLQMTLEVMQQYGIRVEQGADTLSIKEITPTFPAHTTEGDWSAAAPWYQLAALQPSAAPIHLPNLSLASCQPDAALAQLYEPLGVHTSEGVQLTASQPGLLLLKHFVHDLSQNIDLFPTLALTCVGVGVPFSFMGAGPLRQKESNRLLAIRMGLEELGYQGFSEEEDKLAWDGTCPSSPNTGAQINTHNDHRITMAFAVFARAFGLDLSLTHPESVSKSYPTFWQDLNKIS